MHSLLSPQLIALLNSEKGTDGKSGFHGSKGEKGERGLEGPYGRRGFKGSSGVHGIPATCVYAGKNLTNGTDLFLPPQIPVASSNAVKPIIVREKDNVRLQCKATGIPEPTIVWSREKSKLFDGKNWRDHSKTGPLLNITQINRLEMGTYICVADNGITPAATYKFNIEVHCKMSLELF